MSHPCLGAKHSPWAGIIFLKMCLSPPVAADICFFVFWKPPMRAAAFIKPDPVSLCTASNMFMWTSADKIFCYFAWKCKGIICRGGKAQAPRSPGVSLAAPLLHFWFLFSSHPREVFSLGAVAKKDPSPAQKWASLPQFAPSSPWCRHLHTTYTQLTRLCGY